MFSNLIVAEYCFAYLVDQISIDLLLYSHIPTALSSLLISGFIYFKVRDRKSFLLLATCLMFTLWSFSDLGSWFVFLGPAVVMFTWSLLDVLALLMFFFCYSFLYAFIYDRPLPLWQNLISLGLILPTVATTFAGANLPLYDANNCAAIEHEVVTRYPYIVQAIYILAAAGLAVRAYISSTIRSERSKILYSGIGVFVFLSFFFSATFVVSLLAESDLSLYVYNYEIYGLFGMPILLMYLGFLIVRYKAFDIKLAGAQALVAALTLLVSAQLFFISSTSELVIKILTTLLVVVFGFFLVRSVKREIKEKERNESLAKDLAKANKRLRELDQLKSEFVSIASHQLRSPLTAIRGYASMLIDGDFGAIPTKAYDALTKIDESSHFMALSIDDFLNVSRIESGSMKYEKSVFSLKGEASKVVDELRPAAIKKGLVLMFRSTAETDTHIDADIGKIRQVLQNIIDNAMKYTPKGQITVVAHDDPKLKKAYISVIDTGIGMSPDTATSIFDKFVRAKNANTVNVFGTGLGLYIAKQMVEAMGGSIIPSSEGEGKGSTFKIELPLKK